MKHTMKRGFSLAVALCMVLSLLSLPGVSVARAATGEPLYYHAMDAKLSNGAPDGWTRSTSSQNAKGSAIVETSERTYLNLKRDGTESKASSYFHYQDATILDTSCVLKYDLMVDNRDSDEAAWTVYIPSLSHAIKTQTQQMTIKKLADDDKYYLYFGQTEVCEWTPGVWYSVEQIFNGYTIEFYLNGDLIKTVTHEKDTLGYIVMGIYCSSSETEANVGLNLDELYVYDSEGYVPGAGGEEEDSNIVIAGTNVTLQNNLDMNFYVEKADLPAETANVKAVLTRTYANGSDDHEVEVPFAQWTSYGDYYYITYTGMTAKSMTDSVTVQIFDGEEQISEDYTDTIATYAKRMFGSEDLDDKWDPVYAAMLKYGAAAQTTWNYGTGAMADADMTVAMLNAIPSVSANYTKTGDETYKGMTMKLENTIETQMVFSGISEGMTAEVSYTKYNAAQPTTFTVEFDDMVSYGGSIYGVKIDSLVVADVDSEITVTIMNGEDEVATATDCIAGYVTRMSNGSDVFSAIYTLGNAAYTAFTAN